MVPEIIEFILCINNDLVIFVNLVCTFAFTNLCFHDVTTRICGIFIMKTVLKGYCYNALVIVGWALYSSIIRPISRSRDTGE